jgi:hypothetical protein
MWLEVNEVMYWMILYSCTHMYAYVLMYARSYVKNLSIQLYLNVCNLYMLLFLNYVQFYPATYVCNLFRS